MKACESTAISKSEFDRIRCEIKMIKEKYLTDVALVTVTNTEFNAVMHFHDWKSTTVEGDKQVYQTASFERDGKTYSMIHVQQPEMGMTSAAATATKLIYEFRPRYIIMVGIAAGVAQEDAVDQMYGDVVVPDIVWNYSVGKFVSPSDADISFGDIGFVPRSTHLAIPNEVMPYIRMAIDSPENECHVHVGPMACGSSVVANRKILEKQIHSQLSTTAGLDMESYAVVYAAVHASQPRPIPIIVKSVCDYADSKKTDQYQKFAAYTSCEFAKLLYEKDLPYE